MELQLYPFPVIVCTVLAAIAAFTDIRQFKVYNALTFPAIACGLLYHTFFSGWAGLATSTSGVFIALLIMLLPYLLGALGAGDVKFLMALGAWLGGAPLVPVFLVGVAATTVYGVLQAATNRNLTTLMVNVQISLLRFASLGRMLAADDSREDYHDWVNHKDRHKKLIPFSAMLALGLLVTIVWFINVQSP